MSNGYFTYRLVDPRNNIPFYVGKGSGDRDRKHIVEAHQSPDKWINTLKCRRILNIEEAGLSVIIQRTCDNVSEVEAYRQEIAEIKMFGKIIDGTGCLTNISNGGEGGSDVRALAVKCYTVDGELVASFSSLTEGAAFADVHKSTICAALNNRTVMAGGYRWSYEGEDPSLTKHRDVSPVTQYTLEGIEMAQFPSIQAAARAVNITYTSIVGCCTGHHETAAGYRWCYKGHTPKPLLHDTMRYRPKKYQAFNTMGQLVGTFDTIKDATTNTDGNATGISDCCAGRKKSSGGLVWKYLII